MNRLTDWIQTVRGRKFYPFNPRPEDITIEDIAIGLSNTCRFSGQIQDFYSVAQHSVYCAEQAKPEHALAVLLHDASEAYIGDMNRVTKRYLPEYKAVEALIQEAVRVRFNIPTFDFPELHEIDNRVLLSEKRDLLVPSPEPWNVPFEAYPPDVLTVEPWLPRKAADEFSLWFDHLLARRPSS